jgi:phosphoglycerol transferase MdoB-like AlkP superfamily enzyme
MRTSPAVLALVRRLAPFAALFLIVSTLVRLTLAARVMPEIGLVPFLDALLFGAIRDLAVLGVALVPVIVWWIILPSRWQGRAFDRWMTIVGFTNFAVALIVVSIAEHLFWTEFTTRFNFIAVDYLVYTQEVIGNIRESYPVGWALAAVGVAGLVILFLTVHRLRPAFDGVPFTRRAMIGVASLVLVATCMLAVGRGVDPDLPNAWADEVAGNGPLGFVQAFLSNEIRFRQLYPILPDDEVQARVTALLTASGGRIERTGDTLTRVIEASGTPRRDNIVVVVMESMSAEFLASFGNRQGLTPNLDRLAGEGLNFANTYATGTRTVRGLEAITLAVPPTPGQSIVRRPNNAGLYSLGSVLADQGYDTAFLYGGFGFFDNMNAFYAANGFRIVDRGTLSKDEIRFANVWGVSDEDLFARALKEADAADTAGRPFLHLVMTTSNHRPYTFPDGAVDVQRFPGRLGGVVYADRAIGGLVEAARAKPWFAHTIFVFVADHTASAAGRFGLDLERYRIPMIVWAPGRIAPQHVDALASQVDLAPTLMGLLNLSYRSRFYGRDLLATPAEAARAFVSTYEKVGMTRAAETSILEPGRKFDARKGVDRVPPSGISADLIADTTAIYQYASDWRRHSQRIDSRLSAP